MSDAGVDIARRRTMSPGRYQRGAAVAHVPGLISPAQAVSTSGRTTCGLAGFVSAALAPGFEER